MAGIKKVIRRLVHRLGFDLRQRHTMGELLFTPTLPTAGITLEFIGTMGVGKTTLFNESIAPIKNRWYFGYHLWGVALTDYQPNCLEQLHREILFRRINRVNAEVRNAWHCVTEVESAVQTVYESLLISSQDFPRGFALHEGLFKNLPREILSLSDEESAPLWKKRAFVYIRARDAQLAVERFQNRTAKRRKGGDFYHHQSDEEVRLRVEFDTLIYDRISEKACAMGCPLLLVDAEENVQGSVKKILEFEKSIVSSPRLPQG